MADQTAPNDLDVALKEVEKDLLLEIVKNLDQNKITPDQAQLQAKEFLALLPIQDKKDLLDKLYKLSQTNLETKGVYLNYARSYDEEERHKKLELMSQHIKKGEIEHALTVAKGGIPNG